MRFVCLDTETTGLRVTEGNTIIDIGLVEIVNNQKTDRTFQSYLKCDKKLDKVVINVTNITDDMLVGKPEFAEIVPEIMNFFTKTVDGVDDKAVLVAHNAKFDMSFLNYQLQGAISKNFSDFQIIDTIDIIRVAFPGSKLSLDSICKRYNIDLTAREQKGHGALLDADLLADVFLHLIKEVDINEFLMDRKVAIEIKKRTDILQSRMIHKITEDEMLKHIELLKKISCNEW